MALEEERKERVTTAMVTMDARGRLVVPKRIRALAGLSEGTLVAMFASEEHVMVWKLRGRPVA